MKLVSAVLCLFSSVAIAQTGVRYDNRVSTVQANVPVNASAPVLAVPNASVLICNDGACQSPASIFSNQAMTVPTSNPLTSDGRGMFGFWAAAGTYFYQVTDFKGNIVGTYPITLGGSSSGGTPVGPQYKIGAFNGTPSGGNAQLGASNAFTDATGNPLTVPGALAALTTNSVTNTDIKGGIASTLNCANCTWAVPFGSGDSNNPFTYFNGMNSNQYSGHDYRTGFDFYQNWNNGTYPWASGKNCTYGPTGVAGVSGGAALGGCDIENFSKVGGGISGDVTWTNFQPKATLGFFMTRGQSYHHADNLAFMKAGDSIIREVNANFRGAATGFGDEANKFTSEHLIGLGALWGTVSVAGANNTSTGIAPIKVSVTGGSGVKAIMDGGYVVFEDEPVGSSTTITGTSYPFGNSGPQLLTTSTNHAVSTWQAALSADCGAYSHRDVKVNTTCTVNVTVDTIDPVAGDVISIADPTAYEQVVVVTPPTHGTGTKTIVIKSSIHHYAANSTQFMEGGTAGTIGIFANGLANPTTNPAQFQGWPIAGSPDATHEYVMVNYKQGQQGTFPIILPQLSTQSLPTTACAAGVVTVAAGGIDTTQNFTRVLQGAEALVVAGASANNGTITGLTVNDDGSATWTAPGGTCGSASSTGGTLTVSNSQGFFHYCGAETIAITDGTWTYSGGNSFFQPNGSLNLDPNSCTMAANERFVQPNRVEGEAQMYGSQFFVPDATVGANLTHVVIDGGPGLSGQPFMDHQTSNNLDATVGDYAGHGGKNKGMVSFREETPVLGFSNLSFAPFQYYAHIGCPLGGCKSTSVAYPLFANDGLSAGGTFSWNPAQSRYEVAGPLAFGSSLNGRLTRWSGSGVFAMLNFSGDDSLGNAKGFFGQATDGILYHAIPSGGQETWRWGSSGSNTGSLTSTNFDYPGFSIGGNPLCQQNGTNCPSSGGGVSFTPTTSQQVIQPLGTTLSATSLNSRILVAAAPATCSGAPWGTHSTQFDCAQGYATAQANATGNSVALDIGAGIFQTCDGMREPTGGFWKISYFGAGPGVTTIQASSVGGCAVAGTPLFNNTAGFGRFEVDGINFDANAIASSCHEGTSIQSVIERDTDCHNVNIGLGNFVCTSDGTTGNFTGCSGTFPAVGNFVMPRFTRPGPPLTVTAVNSGAGTITVALQNVFGVTSGNFPPALTGGMYNFTVVDHIEGWGTVASFAEDSHIYDATISAPYTSNVTFATLAVGFSGSAVTSVTCSSLCGSYGSGINYLQVGFNDPLALCTTLPVAHVSAMSGLAISTIVVDYGGNCTGAPYAWAAPMQEVPYAFKYALSDSTIDTNYSGTGKIGMYEIGGDTKVSHFHPTQNEVGFEGHGNVTWDSTECDTIYQFCAQFWGTSPDLVKGTHAVTGTHVLPGMGSFYYGAAEPVMFASTLAMFTSSAPTGYNLFLNPSGIVIPGGTGWPALASNWQTDHVKAGSAVPTQAIDYMPAATIPALNIGLPSVPILGTDANGKIISSSIASTPRVASGFCTGTFTSSTTIGIPGLGVALSTGGCTGTRAATSGFMMNGTGTLANLKMRCATTGVNSSSGVLTLNVTHAGSGSTFTPTGLTLTYGTTTANTVLTDNTHTFVYSDGDLLTTAITTQATETLATCNVSVTY